MPETGILLDSADQAAYARYVLARVDEVSELLLVTPSDSVRYTVDTDSVEFDYRIGTAIGPEGWRLINGNRYGRSIVATAQVTDPTVLSAVLSARSLSVAAFNPLNRKLTEQNFVAWQPNRWLRRIQVLHRTLNPMATSDGNRPLGAAF